GELGRGLRFLAGDALLAFARGNDGRRLLCIPDAFRLALGVVVLLEIGIEPAAGIFPGLGAEARVDLPVIAWRECLDLLFALNEDRERRRLHAPYRGEVEATFLGIEGSHGTRAVDAHQPVRFRAALRRVGERQQLAVRAQFREALADRLRRHRLQPQALDRFFDARVLHDVAEDELALASGVAGVDERAHVLALHQAQQQIQPLLAFLERRQFEARRDD